MVVIAESLVKVNGFPEYVKLAGALRLMVIVIVAVVLPPEFEAVMV